MSEMLAQALKYIQRGWYVLPLHGIVEGRCTCGRQDCQSPGKHPRTPHGVKDATNDVVLAQLFDWTDANIGIATGIRSDLAVLDFDVHHGGLASSIPLEARYGELPLTLEVRTGGGGVHLYYRYFGSKVPNSASKLGLGVDVRGDGGYVVAPPSLHISGERYVWGDDTVAPVALPLTWQEAILMRPSPRQGARSDMARFWLAKALERSTEGTRNEVGFWLACQLRDAGVGEVEACVTLQDYARGCPAGQHPYTVQEALATCRSAYAAQPRDPAVSRTTASRMVASTAELGALLEWPPPLTAGELIARYPQLSAAVIDGILRLCEILNLIGASKSNKSWLVLYIALSVACGRALFGRFAVEQGDVLLIDNELHAQTLAHRIQTVAKAMGLEVADYASHLHIEPLRGRLQDLHSLKRYFDKIEPGRYRLIILDAFYRFLPPGTDENDNGAMANLYNVLDAHAQRLQCAFIMIHHSSKGGQADKSVTDVGAGAGAMARATDTHVVLRPHEEEGVAVLDCVARSWQPLPPLCLRWEFPLWYPADDLDPTLLRRPGRKREQEQPTEPPMTAPLFVSKFITAKPQGQAAIIARANLADISARKANGLLRVAVEDGLVYEWRSIQRNEPTLYSTEPCPDPLLPRARAHTPHTPRGCDHAPRGRRVAPARPDEGGGA